MGIANFLFTDKDRAALSESMAMLRAIHFAQEETRAIMATKKQVTEITETLNAINVEIQRINVRVQKIGAELADAVLFLEGKIQEGQDVSAETSHLKGLSEKLLRFDAGASAAVQDTQK